MIETSDNKNHKNISISFYSVKLICNFGVKKRIVLCRLLLPLWDLNTVMELPLTNTAINVMWHFKIKPLFLSIREAISY